jgi:hypothetical protein
VRLPLRWESHDGARVACVVLAAAEAPAAFAQFSLFVVDANGSMLRPRCDLTSIYPGESAAALFRLRNTGSTAATLSTVTVVGAGLSIPDRPVLPATQAPRTAVNLP